MPTDLTSHASADAPLTKAHQWIEANGPTFESTKRVAIAAARVLVAADKKRGVTTSPAVRELAAESAATAIAVASAEGHTGKAD